MGHTRWFIFFKRLEFLRVCDQRHHAGLISGKLEKLPGDNHVKTGRGQAQKGRASRRTSKMGPDSAAALR